MEKYEKYSAAWWEANMNLVLDGVTLTMAPKTLTGRVKHAAQRIVHMWMRKGERVDPNVHTFNRYGVQQQDRVCCLIIIPHLTASRYLSSSALSHVGLSRMVAAAAAATMFR